jgi:hypothetical protein
LNFRLQWGLWRMLHRKTWGSRLNNRKINRKNELFDSSMQQKHAGECIFFSPSLSKYIGKNDGQNDLGPHSPLFQNCVWRLLGLRQL